MTYEDIFLKFKIIMKSQRPRGTKHISKSIGFFENRINQLEKLYDDVEKIEGYEDCEEIIVWFFTEYLPHKIHITNYKLNHFKQILKREVI